MSNASLGWSVNDKEVLASFQKMQGELDKQKQKVNALETASKSAANTWANGLREISREQQKILGGHDKWQSGLNRIAASNRAVADASRANAMTALRGMTQTTQATANWSDALSQVSFQTGAVGMATVALGVAVAAVVQRYEDWTQQVTELGKAQAETAKQMQAVTFGREQPGRVASALRNIPGVTDMDAAKIFEAVQRETPRAGAEQNLRVTAMAARQAAVGVPTDQVSTFAGAMAEMAQKMPDQPLERIADITTNLKAMTGEKFAEVSGDAFQRTIGELKSAGVTPETATAFAAMSRNADLSAKMMEQVAGKLPQVRGGGTPDEKLNRLLEDEKLQRKLLGKDFDLKLNQISPAALAEAREQLTKKGTFASALQPQTEDAARATAENFTKEFSKESGTQRGRADIGFARERLREFYEGAGFPKWQVEGYQLPIFGTKIGGKMQGYDLMTGEGIPAGQAAIAQLRAEMKAAGAPTTPQGIENQKNALRLIQILEKIEENQRLGVAKNLNRNLEPAE